ncbi:MAG: hypothetical protein L0215_17465, partial [Gemmataceae bacterium]|nr:hypothetical protein [Gemmataceae bacterium]
MTVATAVSVHRPRDVVIIMDLSGSMRFQSVPGIPLDAGKAYVSASDRPRTVSMNPEGVFPIFGHYSDTTAAALQGTMVGYQRNTSGGYSALNRNPAGSSLSSVPNTALIGPGDYYAWGTKQIKQKPDVMLKITGNINNSSGYAVGAGFSSDIAIKNLPVDPDVAATKWFVRFAGHNTLYRITSTTLTSGKVTGIRIDNGAGKGLDAAVVNSELAKFYNHQVGTAALAYAAGAGYLLDILVNDLAVDPDIQNGAYVRMANDPTSLYYVTSVIVDPLTGRVISFKLSNGNGGGLRNALPAGTEMSFLTEMPTYIDYNDNPHRPRQQLWFGPQTFIDYLGNYNTARFWWPGNVHEAQAWACKVGIQTAIDDIKKNHPSDFIGLVFFSSPKFSATGAGQHNKAVVPLGRNYQQLKDSLWFPPSTITGTAKEITPYDPDFDNVPRAKGGTSPGMGFMLAYNMFSNGTDLRLYSQPQPQYRGHAGGLGRKGASRLVIFETDGAPNTRAVATLSGSGNDSYYPIRIKYPEKMTDTGNTEWPTGGTISKTEVYSVVEQLCKNESAGGYSTLR